MEKTGMELVKSRRMSRTREEFLTLCDEGYKLYREASESLQKLMDFENRDYTNAGVSSETALKIERIRDRLRRIREGK